MNIILMFYIFYPSKTSVSILKVREKPFSDLSFFFPFLWFVSEIMGFVSLWHWEALIVVTCLGSPDSRRNMMKCGLTEHLRYMGFPRYRQQRGPHMWFLHGLSSKLWRVSHLWIIFKGYQWIYSKTVRKELPCFFTQTILLSSLRRL